MAKIHWGTPPCLIDERRQPIQQHDCSAALANASPRWVARNIAQYLQTDSPSSDAETGSIQGSASLASTTSTPPQNLPFLSTLSLQRTTKSFGDSTRLVEAARDIHDTVTARARYRASEGAQLGYALLGRGTQSGRSSRPLAPLCEERLASPVVHRLHFVFSHVLVAQRLPLASSRKLQYLS